MLDSAIVLNSTAEFCRQVGEEDKQEKRRVLSVAEGDDEEAMEVQSEPHVDSVEGGWNEVRGATEKREKPQVQYNYSVHFI